jgi:hypothetical protein
VVKAGKLKPQTPRDRQAEWTKGEANPSFIVTSHNKAQMSAQVLYEDFYCARHRRCGADTHATGKLTCQDSPQRITTPHAVRRG